MAFLKRLGFYLIGLAIGIVFLTVFLKQKTEGTGTEFCYFPNCRTLKDIRSKDITYSDAINSLLKDKKLDSTDITNFLHDGSVDFKNSDTKSSPCKSYLIEAPVNNRKAILRVSNCLEKSILEEVTFQ
ncbi:hypothetical protein [Arenibacter certesii]|uniref:DUF4258 domain-containing protein n=1 Tax=Arenibacter certesii TaxID=228955 RepID=A0A918IPP5_9FLAO|nr:hypothetical protein [Arenibacter certesii]GGW25772.1 hypothetical protein GCM10007383_08240 [Arenibacter certesii]